MNRHRVAASPPCVQRSLLRASVVLSRAVSAHSHDCVQPHSHPAPEGTANAPLSARTLTTSTIQCLHLLVHALRRLHTSFHDRLLLIRTVELPHFETLRVVFVRHSDRGSGCASQRAAFSPNLRVRATCHEPSKAKTRLGVPGSSFCHGGRWLWAGDLSCTIIDRWAMSG
jgi:hypothetical protein